MVLSASLEEGEDELLLRTRVFPVVELVVPVVRAACGTLDADGEGAKNLEVNGLLLSPVVGTSV